MEGRSVEAVEAVKAGELRAAIWLIDQLIGEEG